MKKIINLKNLIIYILLATNLIGWSILGIVKGTFLGELAISFLPQIISISLITTFLTAILIFTNKKKIYLAFAVLVIIGFIGINTLQIISFYDTTSVSATEIIDEKTKVLSINLFYQNYNYSAIKTMINEIDSDILIMVEFSDEHAKNLQKNLDEKYSYSTLGLSNFGDNVIYSKYPILDSKFTQEKDSFCGFVKAEIELNNKHTSIYAVHTTAPLTEPWLRRRNHQLKMLADEIKDDTNESMIIAGDFNLSPWSPDYSQFEKEVDTKVKNITKQNGPNFTWNFGIPFANSHIDHAFTSDSLQASNLQIISLEGSDHKGIYFELLN